MSDPYVFHFVPTAPDGKLMRGEPVATLCIEPAEYARLGKNRVEKAIEAERHRWVRAVRLDMGPDWGVNVVRERGYVRTIFPGAALPSSPIQAAVVVPGQGRPT